MELQAIFNPTIDAPTDNLWHSIFSNSGSVRLLVIALTFSKATTFLIQLTTNNCTLISQVTLSFAAGTQYFFVIDLTGDITTTTAAYLLFGHTALKSIMTNVNIQIQIQGTPPASNIATPYILYEA